MRKYGKEIEKGEEESRLGRSGELPRDTEINKASDWLSPLGIT